MVKILVVLLWPVGIAVIIGTGALLARRTGAAGVLARPEAGRATETVRAGHGRHLRQIAPDVGRLAVVLLAGGAAVYAIMAALGLIVVRYAPAADEPIFRWTVAHRLPAWAHVVADLTKIGDTWTTWGVCVSAAVCLAVTWREKRWLPAAVLVAVIIIDHFTAVGLRQTFHRAGPPTSPAGTYPSGGVDRVFLMYGLVAYLLWREFSRSRRAAVWWGTAVTALGFNEAYSRAYLTLHWFTDTLAGAVFGCLQLAVFITAVHWVAWSAPVPAEAKPVGARPG
jgi:undecaprenyl-diphosphatase